MELIPKKPTSYPVPLFREVTMVVFGSPGSGKTTFCAGDDRTLFIGTEPGQEFTTAAVVPCYSWQTFISIIDEVKAKRAKIRAGELPLEACPYVSFVIDIVDNLAAQCRDFVCAKKGLLYPPTNDFGKTWSEFTAEWKKKITELMLLGNVRFISHCSTEDVEVSADNGLNVQVNRWVPTFSGGKPAQFLDGIVNAMGYASVDKSGRHVITFQKTATVGAKDRTGILSKCGVLPLDWKTCEAAYNETAKELGMEVKSIRGGSK